MTKRVVIQLADGTQWVLRGSLDYMHLVLKDGDSIIVERELNHYKWGSFIPKRGEFPQHAYINPAHVVLYWEQWFE